MRKLLVVLLGAWSTIAFGQGTWSNQVAVSAPGFSNARPRIALMADNSPIVMWGDDVSSIVYTASWNGSSFDAPVRVHSTGTEAFTSYWAGPDIAAHGDTVYIGLAILPEIMHGMYSVRSVDGGQTWEDTVRIDNLPNGQTRFPTVAVNDDGHPVYAYMVYDDMMMDPQYHVSTSSDWGITFGADVNGTGQAAGEVCDCCPANVQIEGDRQVLTFRNNEVNLRETWVAISDDGGATFPNTKRVDTTGWTINACPSIGPDALLNGDMLTTVFMSRGTAVAKVYVSETDVTNFGIDYMSMLKTADTVTEQSNYIRVAGGDNVMAAVWQYTEWGNPNIYMTFSSTGAAGLVDNIDTANSSSSSLVLSPDIAYADGVFHVIWKDNDSGVVMYRTLEVPYVPATGIEDGRGDLLNFSASPNPFSESTIIRFDNPENELFELEIYDIAGRIQRKQSVKMSSVEISADELKPGTYIYVLSGSNKTGRGKLMVQ
ncbi:MAG: T9SS type A sorting domain-containing protein [Flavobacteriales bacterium]|nr:T9SS type A sorting domain-containing protein [Flavobacteriales bacterium]